MTTQAEQPLLVRGRWLFLGGAAPEQVITDGAVAIKEGAIVAVGRWPDLQKEYPDAPVRGSDRHAVLPGLVNAHHHSQGATQIQLGVEDQLLEPWLLDLARRRRADPYLVTQLAAARLLRSGVTSVVDVHAGGGPPDTFAHAIERKLQAYEQAGIRVAFAFGMSSQSHIIWGDDNAFVDSLPAELQSLARQQLPGPHDVGIDDYFALFDKFWQQYRNHPTIDLWFAPPGPQWVSDAFMQQIAEAAERYDTGIQTHLEESIYEKHYGPRVYGVPTIEHLHRLGLLSPRLSFAHGVWLTEPELALLAESGAAVSHNPSSNLRLRAGIAPLNGMLAAGVSTALGMDGTTLNDNEDMWQEMRLALRLHRTPQLKTPAPTPADIFKLATHGGATLLRAADQRGALAVGHRADLILLDLAQVTWPYVAPEVDPLALVLYRASAADVDTVLVGGEVVVENGEVTTLDVAEAGRALAESLAAQDYPAENAAMVEALKPHLIDYYTNWPLQPLEPYIAYNSKS